MELSVSGYDSPIGPMTIACDDSGVVGVWFVGQRYFGAGLPIGDVLTGKSESVERCASWLDDYFSGRRPDPRGIALSSNGTDFQHTVWDVLKDIPYGRTVSYGEIAHLVSMRLGRTTSPRAVGGAVGRNPISIIIPCHRVIGSDGGLTGYAGGIDRKIWLLEHEGIRIDTRSLDGKQ